MDAITVICEGSMVACAELVKNGPETETLKDGLKVLRGMTTQKMAQVLTPVLRQVMLEKLDGFMGEWKNGLDANVGPHWLKTIVNTQCHEVAIETVKRVARAHQ